MNRRVEGPMKIFCTINSKPKILDVPANLTLIELLHSQGLWSVKRGCENGDCGNCAVIVDGQAAYSCLILAVQVEGKSIETFERINSSKKYTHLKEVFMHYGDIECGYCVAGLMMSIKALLDSISDPTEEEVVDALAGNVCRCAKRSLPVADIIEAIQKMRGNFNNRI